METKASTVRVQDGGIEYRYEVVTAVHGVKAYQLTFYGAAASMKRARKSIARAAGALAIPERPPVAMEQRGARVVHHQLGFEYEPPGEGWQAQPMPMAEALGLTGGVYLFSADQAMVFVAAFVDPASGTEGSDYLNLFEAMAGQLAATIPGKLVRSEEQVEFAGQGWDHMRLGMAGDYYMTSLGGVIYLLAVTVDPGARGAPDPDEMRDGFEFLE